MSAGTTKPKWAECPHCGADLLKDGLIYDCTHRIELSIEADGALVVRADRDLQGGVYMCGCCGEDISCRRLEEVDSADWQNA